MPPTGHAPVLTLEAYDLVQARCSPLQPFPLVFITSVPEPTGTSVSQGRNSPLHLVHEIQEHEKRSLRARDCHQLLPCHHHPPNRRSATLDRPTVTPGSERANPIKFPVPQKTCSAKTVKDRITITLPIPERNQFQTANGNAVAAEGYGGPGKWAMSVSAAVIDTMCSAARLRNEPDSIKVAVELRSFTKISESGLLGRA